MPVPPKVLPGDLITAEHMNLLIDMIALHEQEIQTLLSGTAVPGAQMLIFSPLPTDTFHMGEELRIFGQGFGVPTLNTVMLDDTHQISIFKAGSNDKLLIVDLPTYLIAPEGKLVNLTVNNNSTRGFAATSFKLLPPVATVPEGNVAVGQPPATTISPPAADLVLNVNANVTMDETYTVTPKLTPPQATGWDAFLADIGGNRITPSEVTIPKGGSQQIRIRVAIPSGATGTATLNVTVASKRNPDQVSNSSGIINLPVGSTTVPDKIDVQFSMVFAGNGKLTNDPEGPTIVVPAGKETEVDYLATLPAKGDYTVATPAFSGAAGSLWTSRILSVAKLKQVSGQVGIGIGVTPQTGAQPTTVTVHISADADPTGTVGNRTFRIRVG